MSENDTAVIFGVCHALNKPFVLTNRLETRGFDSSPQFPYLTQSVKILATGGTLVSVQGQLRITA